MIAASVPSWGVGHARRCGLHADAPAWGRCRACKQEICYSCFDEARTRHGRCLTCRIGGPPQTGVIGTPGRSAVLPWDDLPHEMKVFVLFPPPPAPCPLCARRGLDGPVEPLPLVHHRFRTAPRDADRHLAALLGPPGRPSFGRAVRAALGGVRLRRLALLAVAVVVLQPKMVGAFAFTTAVGLAAALVCRSVILYWQWPDLVRSTWESARFCHRHRVVFVPGRPAFVGADDRRAAAFDVLWDRLSTGDGECDGDDAGDDGGGD